MMQNTFTEASGRNILAHHKSLKKTLNKTKKKALKRQMRLSLKMNILNNQKGGAYQMSHNWKDVLSIDSIQQIILVLGGDVIKAHQLQTDSNLNFFLVHAGYSA